MYQLPFHHPQHSSRGGVADNPGKEWFVAKDVAEVLDIKNSSQAKARLDPDERSMHHIERRYYTLIINKFDFYSIVFVS